MKKCGYRFLTTVIFLCIIMGAGMILTVHAETAKQTQEIIESDLDSIPIYNELPTIQPLAEENEEIEESSIAEQEPSEIVEESIESETMVLQDSNMSDEVVEPYTETDIIYANNSNFQDVMKSSPKKIILTEPIVWNKSFDDGIDENSEFVTEIPIEIVLGEHNISIEENNRLKFKGPFEFKGEQNMFDIAGELFLNGASVIANGNRTTAITFSEVPVCEGSFTKYLEMDDCKLQIQGEETIGIHMENGTNAVITNSIVACDGEKSVGVIDEDDTVISIYKESRFEVNGDGAVGLVFPENTSQTGFLKFDTEVYGDNSCGVAVSDGIYTNSGTITVTGSNSVGVHIKDGVEKIENGAVIVLCEDSIGVLADGDLNALRLSLESKNGVAAEAQGSLNLILCDINTHSYGLLSHSVEIILDTCMIDKIPQYAVVKTRKARPYLNGYKTADGDYLTYDVGTFGFSTPVGAKNIDLPNTLLFSLYDEDLAVDTIELPFDVVWEKTAYDADTVGDYEISYLADTDGFAVKIAGTVTVHVYESDEPRLIYAQRLGDARTELYFVPKTGDAEQIRLLASTDGGKNWIDYLENNQAHKWGHLGFVETDKLEENVEYLLKLEIIGGTSAGTSPILSYWRNEREIKWSNGDRDGGDQRPKKEDENLSEKKQNTNTPSNSNGKHDVMVISPSFEKLYPNKNTAEPAFNENVIKYENDNNVIEITKSEFEEISQVNPEKITVISKGIKAELPTEEIKNIYSQQEESVSIVLDKPKQSTFSVKIYAGDEEIHSWGNSPINITVSGQREAKIAVEQESGEIVKGEEVNENQIIFPIVKTGTYTMDTQFSEQEVQEHDKKLLVWIWPLCALLLIGIILLSLRLIFGGRRLKR